MKFPTTRRLAEFLDVPHYYVLPYFAMMEQEELVTRAEHVGILTTAKGSRKMIDLMREKYPEESSEILGSVIFEELMGKYDPRAVPESSREDSKPQHLLFINCLPTARSLFSESKKKD